jgi:IS4 transposase
MWDEILQKFLDEAPVAVMVGASIARTPGDSTLDGLFERHADAQYTRELTFSALTRLMTQVVFCTYPSVNAAYQKNREISVSITSVYNKLNGLETGISQALVAETAGAMDAILRELPHPPKEPVPGVRLRTLDGNFLAGTDHRLACLRGSGAAALPGMSLVVRDGRTGLLTDLIPCEDAYTNERALAEAVLTLVEPGDLWLADRNFCTDTYLGGIQARDAFFLVRYHAGTTLHPLGRESRRRSHPEGTLSEQRVRVGLIECRCIILRLKQPLRDGTTEIRLLTNVPPEQLSARRAADLYRTRWRIETAFQELTESVRCEINTLGYPKAALFGFALAVVSYNLLVLTRGALASGLGEEVGGEEALSSYHMATHVAAVSEGMRIAVPASAWERFVAMTAAEFAGWLYEVARQIDWRPYRKRPRGPKKPVVVKRTRRGAHRSTARELSKSHE